MTFTFLLVNSVDAFFTLSSVVNTDRGSDSDIRWKNLRDRFIIGVFSVPSIPRFYNLLNGV